jgi:hypothetical protein
MEKGKILDLAVGIGGALVGAVLPAFLPRAFGYRQQWTEVARVTVKWYLAAPPALKGTITGVSPADGSKFKQGDTFYVYVSARNDSSVAVYAYVQLIVKGVTSGKEYVNMSAPGQYVDAGMPMYFSFDKPVTMPNEDVQATIILYMMYAV